MYIITLKEPLHNGQTVLKFDGINPNGAFAVGFVEAFMYVDKTIPMDRSKSSYIPISNILGIIYQPDAAELIKPKLKEEKEY